MEPSTYSRIDRRNPIDTRIRVSALWAATMFVFAYVDLFSLYRPDVRENLDAGRMSAFEVGPSFLLFTTAYVVVPSLMIYLSLVLPPRANRWTNLVLAGLYVLTIAVSAIGEWGYFVLGSAVEVVLLAMVIRHAWTGLSETQLSETQLSEAGLSEDR